MPENEFQPRFLDACELLSRREDCESVYFTQLLDLVREAEPGRFVPVVHPVGLAHAIAEFGDRLPAAVAKAQAIKGLLQLDGDVTPETHRMAVRRIESLHRGPDRRRATATSSEGKVGKKIAKSRYEISNDKLVELIKGGRPGAATKATQPVAQRIGFGTLVTVRETSRELLELLEELRQAAEADAQRRPTLAIGVRYRQEWCSRGYNRGDLIRSIPLAADARKEIVVKTWRVRKERREENESIEENISNEYIGDEKWSLAVHRRVACRS